MRVDPKNPPENILPAGTTPEALIAGIEASGYPLQGVVASQLKSDFDVVQEWGYIDRDTKEHRSLDVHAHRWLEDDRTANIQPSLSLLIECKKSSKHPYVFFRDVVRRKWSHFPRVSGIGHDSVPLSAGGTTRYYSASEVMGLPKLAFIGKGPAQCSSFGSGEPKPKSKPGTKQEAKPKYGTVKLSGLEPFHSIVLPLAKAVDYAVELNPYRRQPTFFPSVLLCIAVLDAPMVLVESPQTTSDPVLTPWVRIRRQEAPKDGPQRAEYRHYAIDVVHAAFLSDYIAQHVLPFAQEFARRAQRLRAILVEGGSVQDLDNWSWDQIGPAS